MTCLVVVNSLINARRAGRGMCSVVARFRHHSNMSSFLSCILKITIVTFTGMASYTLQKVCSKCKMIPNICQYFTHIFCTRFSVHISVILYVISWILFPLITLWDPGYTFIKKMSVRLLFIMPMLT